MDIEDRNRQLENDDRKYVWHPFTQMKDYVREKPLIIERGEGSFLWDIYGNKYIDGISSLWVTTHGHCKREIDEAIAEQLTKISHTTLLGLSHPPAIKLAQKLVSITPQGLNKVFYSESGSTAVEIALKMAFQYWHQNPDEPDEKNKFISLRNAYHGDTIGAVGVGGIDLFHKVYGPLLVDPIKVSSPHCYRCDLEKSYPSCNLECITQLEKIMRTHQHETAALIIEPLVQAAAGMLVSPPGFLKRTRELCTRYDILMLADEVAVGMGRTGKMFACEHEDVTPDILMMGKGLTGGYLPLSATMTTDKIYEAFLGKYEDFKTFFHGHTYTGNPLACSAALANLYIFERDGTLAKLGENITLLKEGLKRFWDLRHVGDIRQKGFMAGIELVLDRDSKAPFPTGRKTGIKVIMEARKRGLILRPLGDVIILMPHLNIGPRELHELINITYDSVKHVTEGTAFRETR
ncbi:MAG: adenosylmethionine--8-amino-7-oxononanoate transaminase [Deltaproteobacteria bacterium]|nr:adenosylmethionine--8-amino-7-oxononanoate transaminase [Deltaproteobacteria bacterium]MBW2344325.1 adenosylmethionine--8-amino-7-oxononanoate transaminase [Deltaproteobacteria bacterium]